MSGYLLDTNIISYALRGEEPVVNWLNTVGWGDLYISTLSVAEHLYGAKCYTDKTKNSKEQLTARAELVKSYEDVHAMIRHLPFDDHAAKVFSDIAARCLFEGGKLPMIDGMIGATAVANGLPVVTRDVRPYSRIAGLVVINPYDL